jgi:hypothetical protein
MLTKEDLMQNLRLSQPNNSPSCEAPDVIRQLDTLIAKLQDRVNPTLSEQVALCQLLVSRELLTHRRTVTVPKTDVIDMSDAVGLRMDYDSIYTHENNG